MVLQNAGLSPLSFVGVGTNDWCMKKSFTLQNNQLVLAVMTVFFKLILVENSINESKKYAKIRN